MKELNIIYPENDIVIYYASFCYEAQHQQHVLYHSQGHHVRPIFKLHQIGHQQQHEQDAEFNFTLCYHVNDLFSEDFN
ncbi:hypothetical protein LTR53_006447, partial [Teratosphaeriaceae sp. CCFEE 6253]